jgi:hypothetical protein
LSGRLLYKNYAHFIEKGFKTFLVIQDPFDELAERLLVLSRVRKMGGAQVLGLRDNAGLEATIHFAEQLVSQPLKDEKLLRRKLKMMDADVAAILSNPLTRQLTVENLDGFPTRNAVASALDILSSVAVFGFRSQPEDFQLAVGEFLQIDPRKLCPFPQLEKVPLLAEALKRSGQVESILEQDLEVYEYVMQASQKAIAAIR